MYQINEKSNLPDKNKNNIFLLNLNIILYNLFF